MPDPAFLLTSAQLRSRSGKKWSRYPADVLPAWVADSDFAPMPAVRDTVIEALDAGDLGYPPVSEASGIPERFAEWAWRRWLWKVDPATVHLVPDVVTGMDNCIEALTRSGDAVLVQTPIYPPFRNSVQVAQRRLIEHALVEGQVDFDGLERTLRRERPTIFLLCHPHNPTGRCFSQAELTRLGELVLRYDLTVVSDEIHADLLFDGRRHVPFASLSPETAARTVTLNAASKAFNVAGLRLAVCACENDTLRRALMALPPHRWNAYSTFAVRATRAAWTTEGEQWLTELTTYLQRMRDRLVDRLPAVLPGIRCRPPEATFLAWLDCRELALPPGPYEFFLDRARVALSPGPDFGAPGLGHARLNFATSATILDEILARLGRALDERK